MVESKGAVVRVAASSSAEPPSRYPRPGTSHRPPAWSDPRIPGAAVPVLLCTAYFLQHPSSSLEDSSFHYDDAFLARLAELLG
jgi:hypothetical protein